MPSIPIINDVSTRIDPPVLGVEHSRLSKPMGQSAQKEFNAAYKHIRPITLQGTPRDISAWLADYVSKRARTKDLVHDKQKNLVQWVEITPLLRFRDDVLILVEESEDGGSHLHFRSKSRLGKGDIGANAKRILSLQSEIVEKFGLQN